MLCIPEINISKPQPAQVNENEKMKLTSANLVMHCSNSELAKWQEQHADHASTFGLSSMLLIELLSDP